jgi:uncharacterized protein (DUF58 family)
MEHPRVRRKITQSNTTAGVYAELDDLIRLQFKARSFSFLPRQPSQSVLAGRHASRLRGRGLNFEEIRHYLQGDDLRAIDWKVTARTRKPHVRVFSEERDRSVMLLVDQRISMFFGSQQSMKSVVAAELTALIAWRVLGAGDRVGAIVFNDTGMRIIEPQRNRQQVMKILEAVVEKNHALRVGTGRKADPSMYNTVLRKTLKLAKHDFLICSISDSFGVDDETVGLLSLLRAHNDVLAAFIYDHLEAELPEVGRLVLADDALQLEIDPSDNKLRHEFAREFEERLEWIRHITSLRTIPVLPLHTNEGVPEQLRTILGAGVKGRSNPFGVAYAPV